MTNKRIVTTLMVLVFVVMLTLTLGACESEKNIQVPEVKEDVYVYDQDDCIDDEIEASINSMLKQLEEKTNVEFAIVSISSLSGYTIEEYANELFNTLGIGKAGEDNGVLLLFSKTDSRVRLEIGRGLEGCLNDAKCGRILDNFFVPYRENDDYTQASNNTAIAVTNEIAKEYQVELEGVGEAQGVTDNEEYEATFAIIFVIMVIVFLFLARCTDIVRLSGMGYGGLSGGSSSGRGGFGGGRSGGGGASR